MIEKITDYSLEVIMGFEGFVIRTIIELSLDISICGIMEIAMRQSVTVNEFISFNVDFALFAIHFSCIFFWSRFIIINHHKIKLP